METEGQTEEMNALTGEMTEEAVETEGLQVVEEAPADHRVVAEEDNTNSQSNKIQARVNSSKPKAKSFIKCYNRKEQSTGSRKKCR